MSQILHLDPKVLSKNNKFDIYQGKPSPALIGVLLLEARLRFERAELAQSRSKLEQVYALAVQYEDQEAKIEAVALLMRLSRETFDLEAMQRWSSELEYWINLDSKKIPPKIWHCKAIVVLEAGDYRSSKSLWLKALRGFRGKNADRLWASAEEDMLKTWVSLGALLVRQGKLGRARFIFKKVLEKSESKNFAEVQGSVHAGLASYFLKVGSFSEALGEVHSMLRSYLKEKNWYRILYTYLWYVKVYRKMGEVQSALFYVGILEPAVQNSEFAALNKLLIEEKEGLRFESAQLIFDSKNGFIQTEEKRICFKKQFVLLRIFDSLWCAREQDRLEGLSQSELFKCVWADKDPDEKDLNKLYYNLNRLRKMLEPDPANPKYIQSWKSGYRISPHVRITRGSLSE